MPVARRLREAMIETPSPRSRYVRPHAVEHALPVFIRVESVIKKGPQKPPALRNPESDRAPRLALLLHVRHIIANRRRTEPHHRGIFRRIHSFVNPARLKSRRILDVRHVGRKLPLIPANHSPLAV